jgi:general secretion pathway protein L
MDTTLRKFVTAIASVFFHWIDVVAAETLAILDRFAQPRAIRLVETSDDKFLVELAEQDTFSTPQLIELTDQATAAADLLKCRRVDLVLRGERFLFCPIELPNRAREFLDGIVRSQIDRLTPWAASDAAFGRSEPIGSGDDRMIVTVAAARLAKIKPYVEAIARSGAHSIAIFTSSPHIPVPIRVWTETARNAVRPERIRGRLVAVFLVGAIATIVTAVSSVTLGAIVNAEAEEIVDQLTRTRAAHKTSSRANTATRHALEQRRSQFPASVIVLEKVSQILPDHTYVTEFRLEGGKLRLVGVTRDAPSLIRLLEQSGQFKRATFFAPTTRSVANPGEQFHIEALIQPGSAARS